MRPTSKPTDAVWLAALQTALSREVRPKGIGWKTYAEIQKEFSMPTIPLRETLKDRKRFEKFIGRLKGPRGHQHQIWYRPVAGAKGI